MIRDEPVVEEAKERVTQLEHIDEIHANCRVRPSLIAVFQTIRQSAKARKTILPTRSFSDALNAVGEQFVDALLEKPRGGGWWLEPNRAWHECVVQRCGKRRESRVFCRGSHESWGWLPKEATRLADPMTGPDHVVSVKIPSFGREERVVLEQKLRLGSPQDAIANSRTYLKHLLHKSGHKLPTRSDSIDLESYCEGLFQAVKDVLLKRKRGALTYSGKVPQVVYASVFTEPNMIYLSDSAEGQIACTYAGFLAPIIDQKQVASMDPCSQILQRSAVRLWIGLDELLSCCQDGEVETAWTESVQRLTESIINPQWRTTAVSPPLRG